MRTLDGPHRHLTPEEKAHALTEWHYLLKSSPLPSGVDQGGKGFPDPDIIPWCEALNEIPGVCTIQSCQGHGSAEDGNIISSGLVWLRLDQAMSEAFRRHAFTLAADTRHIEQLSTLYMSWGQEVVSIAFAGNERNLLAPSMRRILEFFQTMRLHADQDELGRPATSCSCPPDP